jgi:hypothetical protein
MNKKELEARVTQLEQAVRWALGEIGDFPGGDEPPTIAGFRQRFFWRTKLAEMAGLRWDVKRKQYSAINTSDQ